MSGSDEVVSPEQPKDSDNTHSFKVESTGLEFTYDELRRAEYFVGNDSQLKDRFSFQFTNAQHIALVRWAFETDYIDSPTDASCTAPRQEELREKFASLKSALGLFDHKRSRDARIVLSKAIEDKLRSISAELIKLPFASVSSPKDPTTSSSGGKAKRPKVNKHGRPIDPHWLCSFTYVNDGGWNGVFYDPAMTPSHIFDLLLDHRRNSRISDQHWDKMMQDFALEPNPIPVSTILGRYRDEMLGAGSQDDNLDASHTTTATVGGKPCTKALNKRPKTTAKSRVNMSDLSTANGQDEAEPTREPTTADKKDNTIESPKAGASPPTEHSTRQDSRNNRQIKQQNRKRTASEISGEDTKGTVEPSGNKIVKTTHLQDNATNHDPATSNVHDAQHRLESDNLTHIPQESGVVPMDLDGSIPTPSDVNMHD